MQRNFVLKKGFSDDSTGATDACELFQIRHAADAAAGNELQIRKFGQDIAVKFDGWAGEFSVAGNVGNRYLANAEAVHFSQKIEQADFSLLFPAVYRHLALAHVGTDEETVGAKFFDPCAEFILCQYGHTAYGKKHRPSIPDLLERGYGTQTTAIVNLQSGAGSHFGKDVQIGRSPGACSVQINHVEAADASLFQFESQFKRVGQILGFLVKIALTQADKFAVQKVERRNDFHVNTLLPLGKLFVNKSMVMYAR